MGPAGSGKSTVSLEHLLFKSSYVCSCRAKFINIATQQDGHTVGHGLESAPSTIRAVRVKHPITGEPVIFIDTPGLDDTKKPDTEILSMIASWLKERLVYYLKRLV